MKVDTQFYKAGYMGLPPWAKGIIAVVVVGGLAFVSYKIYKKVQTLTDPDRKDEKDVIKQVEKDIKVAQQQGQTLSKPLSVYKSTANNIKEKLDGCEGNITTENDVVKLVISVVKKPIDWLQLQKDFDVRKIDNCGIGTGDTEYELGNLLKDQLDQYPNTKIVAEGFTYDPRVSGRKTTYDILKVYLNKIGVSI